MRTSNAAYTPLRQEAETSSLDGYDAVLETMGCQRLEIEEENFKELLEFPLPR